MEGTTKDLVAFFWVETTGCHGNTEGSARSDFNHRIGSAVVAALQSMHDKGLVHGDVAAMEKVCIHIELHAAEHVECWIPFLIIPHLELGELLLSTCVSTTKFIHKK